jgi:glycosyltransferase involved in cell wall biosynthesis
MSLRGARQDVVTPHPLVTIVTPSFNQGGFIRDAIESVIQQTYPRVEHIVVDGGSHDNTVKILAAYSDRLRAIVEPDRGQSEAINKGFRLARGEIVSWLNCDDILRPEAIEKVVAVFAANGNLGMAYGDGYLLDAQGRLRCALPRPGLMNVWKLVHVSYFLLQPATFFRRDVLDEIGLLDESLHWGMDWDLAIRIAKRFSTAYVAAPLAGQREYAETKTATGGHRRFRELVRIMRAHGDLRYPPAYFQYGIDTYEKILSRAIERCAPCLGDGLAKRSQTLLHKVAEWLQLHASTEGAGWFWDGWVTTWARFQFRREGSALVLRGRLPKDFPMLRSQAIDAVVDGHAVFRYPLEFGPFRVLIPIEPGPPFVDLELRSPKSFVPRQSGLNADRRTLCYLLDTIEWVA